MNVIYTVRPDFSQAFDLVYGGILIRKFEKCELEEPFKIGIDLV